MEKKLRKEREGREKNKKEVRKGFKVQSLKFWQTLMKKNIWLRLMKYEFQQYKKPSIDEVFLFVLIIK